MQYKLPDNPRKTICDEKCASGNRYYKMKKYPLTGMMAGINVSSEIDALFENIPAYLSTHEKKVVLSKIAEGSTFDFGVLLNKQSLSPSTPIC